MLQQTTAKAVIPYYERFLKVFSSTKSLARASEKTVYPLWAGLGYYQRAKNLIKAAKEIEKQDSFPSSYKSLIQLPGFGPYTARAVSSLAFEEPVGVLDGNVIRFLSRFHGRSVRWWMREGRAGLQSLADKWVKNQKPSRMNQALMEIGSLICCSGVPFCRLCPLAVGCFAFKNQIQHQLPLKRPKKVQSLFQWTPLVARKKGGLFAFVKNSSVLPVLKGRPVFPGRFQKIPSRPSHYHFRHSIMHYKIYVTVKRAPISSPDVLQPSVYQNKDSGASGTQRKVNLKSFIWLSRKTITQKNPSSLIQKVLDVSSKI